jgi:alpha-tubulin suppressor-like RCC1 family protein
MPFVRNRFNASSRGARFVIALVAAASGALAPACLPDVDFETPSPGNDGGDSGADSMAADQTAPPADAQSDAADSRASTDAVADVVVEADADPNAIGPFAVNLDDDYGLTGTCAVRGGALYCWGANESNPVGELGLPPDTADSGGHPLPTRVTATAEAASQITQLAMGDVHTCTLYGHTPYCRGSNNNFQLGNSSAASGPDEVAVVGLPAGGLDVIAAAQLSTCGITLATDAGTESNVYCWGTNGDGELGRPIGETPPVGATPVTGDIDGGPLGLIPDAIAIAGGGYHHCAISASRGILCWGSTTYRESGPIVGPANCPGGDTATCLDQPQHVTLPATEVPTALALGAFHSCALTQSGNVYCWGWNLSGELGTGSTTLPDSCTDGSETAPCTGVPVQVAISNVRILRAGGETTCAVDDMRHAYCWGLNDQGQDGNGDNGGDLAVPTEVLDPVTLSPFTFDDLSVGYSETCARTGDVLYCWGGGPLGTEAPDGSMPNYDSPAVVQFGP